MRRYIILTLIILLLALIAKDFYNKKKLYSKNLQKIEELEKERDVFYSIFSRYFKQHQKYPLDIVDDLINEEESEDLRKQFNMFFKDPFTNSELYHYIPFKNDSGLIVGYCLLSAGADKKINNEQTEPQFLRDINKIKLYKSKSFNYFDFYFGKKDLLVSAIYNKE